MSKHILKFTVLDPVVLVLTGLAAGLIIYHVISIPLSRGGVSTAIGFVPEIKRQFLWELTVVPDFIDRTSRIIGGSFLVLGAVTAVFGAYVVGASRDFGYSSLANLMGVGRRRYLRFSILTPIIVYLLVPSLASAIIIPPLVDYNLLEYWQVPVALALITMTILAVQLAISILLTHVAANTYRGLILTLIAVYAIGMARLQDKLIVISREMESLNELLMRIAGVAVIAIIVLAIAYMIVERRTTTR
ncbi:MAG: hypothetical protein P3X22_000965 [Thermoprotei archaeon]|nr:hypothetical protein [Thermoprotei archaeon]